MKNDVDGKWVRKEGEKVHSEERIVVEGGEGLKATAEGVKV